MCMPFKLFLLLSFIFNISCAPGDLDRTFGNQGKVVTHLVTGNSDVANSVALQADGKIVAGGFSRNPATFASGFALARYNTNGSLDNTFGNAGIVITPSFTTDSADEIRHLKIDSNQNIVAVGITGSPIFGSTGQVLLARYKPNGALDNSFGTNGRLLISQLSATYQQSNIPEVNPVLIIQPDGKILVASFTTINTFSHFALARVNPNGTLDNTFGDNGIVITPSFSFQSNDVANGITLQSDGKIVVIGTTSSGLNPANFALARYNTNGSLDDTFGNNGQIIVPHFSTNSFDVGVDVAVQSNGNIILAGHSNSQFALTSYKEDGTLNTAFGNNGKTITPNFSPGSVDFLNAIALQVNDKIVAVGVSQLTAPTFAVARYNANGSLDNSFGNNGQVLTSFGPSTSSFANDVAIQVDGKIVVAGREDENFISNFGLVRYNGNLPCINTNDLFILALRAKYQAL